MRVEIVKEVLEKYLKGEDKLHLAIKYNFKSVYSLIAVKRQQLDRLLDSNYYLEEGEILIAHPNLPFYISSKGNVFNCFKVKVICNKTSKGYMTLSCNRKTIFVHRLVLESFVGFSNLTVNHLDGIKDNNKLENLEYITQKENNLHSIEVLGNHQRGSKNKKAKLTEEQVIEIYKAYRPRNKEYGLQALANKYGVDVSLIHLITSGKTWQHVTQGIPKENRKNPLKLSQEAIEDIRSNYIFRGEKDVKYFMNKYNVSKPIVARVINKTSTYKNT